MKKTYAIHLDIDVYNRIKDKVGKGNISAYINSTISEKIKKYDVVKIKREIENHNNIIFKLNTQLQEAIKQQEKELSILKYEQLINKEYAKIKITNPSIDYKAYKKRRLKELGVRI